MRQAKSKNKFSKAGEYLKIVDGAVNTGKKTLYTRDIVDKTMRVSSTVNETLTLKDNVAIDILNFSIISLHNSTNQYPNYFD